MPNRRSLLGRVKATALTLATLALSGVEGCGGGGITEPPRPPTATLTVTPDRVTLPGSVTIVSVCGSSVSASRSWSASTSTWERETVPITSPEAVDFILVCRNAAGETATASARVTGVKPILTGKFATYNTGLGSLGDQRVYATGSAGTDSAGVNPDGTWTLELNSWNDASVTLASDAKDPANRRLFRWEITLKRERWGTPLIYTRVPAPWQFVSGAYASAPAHALSLHFDAAYPNSPAGPLLFLCSLQTWPQFPVPLAFDRERSTQAVSAADSAAYWQRLSDVEAELGWDAWRPASFSEMGYTVAQNGDETWRGVLVRIYTENTGDTWTEGNDVIRGLVKVRIDVLAQKSGPHETVHTLRVGHTWWTGLMFAGGSQSDPEFRVLGSRATAVIQLLYTDANTVRALGPGAKSGIPGSLMGERRTLGLPVEPICDPLVPSALGNPVSKRTSSLRSGAPQRRIFIFDNFLRVMEIVKI